MDSLVERIRDWLKYVDECPPADNDYALRCKRVLIRLSDIEDIRKAADALEQRWIPVSERLPEAQKTVLFLVERHSAVCFGSKESDDPDSLLWWDVTVTDRDGDYSDEFGVTHWMPLPPPPPDTGEAEG